MDLPSLRSSSSLWSPDASPASLGTTTTLRSATSPAPASSASLESAPSARTTRPIAGPRRCSADARGVVGAEVSSALSNPSGASNDSARGASTASATGVGPSAADASAPVASRSGSTMKRRRARVCRAGPRTTTVRGATSSSRPRAAPPSVRPRRSCRNGRRASGEASTLFDESQTLADPGRADDSVLAGVDKK